MPPKHPDTSSVVVNRWHGSETLTEKDRMLRALLSYYEARGVDPFGQADAALLPLSFELPSLFREARPLASLPAWAPFAAAHAAAAAAREPRVPTSWCARNLWLLKPARGSGGEGIWIGSSLCEAEALLRASSQRSVTAWVAQKYIEAPLLFEQRKFDVRMWAAIASDASPLGLACWAYREGYLRTSSAPYSTEAATSDAEAQRVHLTNHCLQRQHESLGEHEEGNTASLAALQRDAPHLRLREEVLPQMFATMADATLAARGALLSGLAAAGRGGEARRRAGLGVVALFGYDFMITAEGRPVLIEINANPMLSANNGWHAQLLQRLAHDYLRLALDERWLPAAPPPPPPPLDGVEVEQFDEGWLCLLHAAAGTGVGAPPRFRTQTTASGVCVRAPQSASPAVAAEGAAGGPTAPEGGSAETERGSGLEIGGAVEAEAGAGLGEDAR
jgi:hypothetical protein